MTKSLPLLLLVFLTGFLSAQDVVRPPDWQTPVDGYLNKLAIAKAFANDSPLPGGSRVKGVYVVREQGRKKLAVVLEQDSFVYLLYYYTRHRPTVFPYRFHRLSDGYYRGEPTASMGKDFPRRQPDSTVTLLAVINLLQLNDIRYQGDSQQVMKKYWSKKEVGTPLTPDDHFAPTMGTIGRGEQQIYYLVKGDFLGAVRGGDTIMAPVYTELYHIKKDWFLVRKANEDFYYLSVDGSREELFTIEPELAGLTKKHESGLPLLRIPGQGRYLRLGENRYFPDLSQRVSVKEEGLPWRQTLLVNRNYEKETDIYSLPGYKKIATIPGWIKPLGSKYHGYYLVNSLKEKGLYNANFEMILPPLYDDIKILHDYGYASFRVKKGKERLQRIADTTGTFITSQWSDRNIDHLYGCCYVSHTPEGFFLDDKSGKPVLNGRYDYYYRPHNAVTYDHRWDPPEQHAVIGLDGKHGVIHRSGTLAIPMRYDSIELIRTQQQTYALLYKNGTGRLRALERGEDLPGEFTKALLRYDTWIWPSIPRTTAVREIAKVSAFSNWSAILRWGDELVVIDDIGTIGTRISMPAGVPERARKWLGF